MKPADRIPAAALKAILGHVHPKSSRLRLSTSAARALGLVAHKKKQSAARATARALVSPQQVLAAALRDRLGADAVHCEVQGLVPGRRFRADIVVPAARLIIEFDGFQYHRSKSAFQKDRERQNLFVAHGWQVLRFFNKQVQADLEGVVNQIVQVVSKNKNAA